MVEIVGGSNFPGVTALKNYVFTDPRCETNAGTHSVSGEFGTLDVKTRSGRCGETGFCATLFERDRTTSGDCKIGDFDCGSGDFERYV